MRCEEATTSRRRSPAKAREATGARCGAAWTQAARLRNAVLLWKGRPGDAVPGDVREADGVGRIVGREPGTGATLTEAYLRQSRRARAVVDEVFYGHE